MTDKAKDYTTFCTPTQNYRFLVMPFGLKTAGATYTRLLKQVLTSEPVLKLYRRDREHVLQTDACHEQIAAILLQREDDGELHPVMYASRKLLPREVRYAIPDKEGIAVFWTVNKFYKYLFGYRFIIQTDCQALIILNRKPSKNPRILRWQIFLQGFDYTIQVIRGADFLSRNGVE